MESLLSRRLRYSLVMFVAMCVAAVLVVTRCSEGCGRLPADMDGLHVPPADDAAPEGVGNVMKIDRVEVSNVLTTSLVVCVQSQSGQPLRASLVEVYPSAAKSARTVDVTQRIATSGVPDANGVHRIPWSSCLGMALRVTAANHQPVWREVSGMTPDSMLVVRLLPACIHEIVVRDNLGMPIAGAVVSVARSPLDLDELDSQLAASKALLPAGWDPVCVTATDDDGEVTVDGLSEGSYVIYAQKPGFFQAGRFPERAKIPGSTSELVLAPVYAVGLDLGESVVAYSASMTMNDSRRVTTLAMQEWARRLAKRNGIDEVMAYATADPNGEVPAVRLRAIVGGNDCSYSVDLARCVGGVLPTVDVRDLSPLSARQVAVLNCWVALCDQEANLLPANLMHLENSESGLCFFPDESGAVRLVRGTYRVSSTNGFVRAQMVPRTLQISYEGQAEAVRLPAVYRETTVFVRDGDGRALPRLSVQLSAQGVRHTMYAGRVWAPIGRIEWAVRSGVDGVLRGECDSATTGEAECEVVVSAPK